MKMYANYHYYKNHFWISVAFYLKTFQHEESVVSCYFHTCFKKHISDLML